MLTCSQVDARAKILMIDDQPANLRLLERILGQGGYTELRGVNDARQSLAAYHEFQPDLILLDLMMPFVDGVGVLERIRPLTAVTYLPIVMLTANVTSEAKRRALAAGATDFLTKPLDAIEVLLRIKNLLQTRSLTKRLEAQFLQAQRLESVALLAGGVAHDFNNMLTVINGLSEMMLTTVGRDQPMYQYIQQIFGAGMRAVALTRQLLAFTRKRVFAPAAFDLNVLVKDSEKMLRRLIGEHIAVSTKLSPNLGMIKADQGMIEQGIMNLAINARDAMPKGGQLGLATANADVDECRAKQHLGVQPGAYVELTVSDNGSGMDEATKARIFEPFFTTKEIGKGTGLGLTTVHATIKQSGGFIEVSSAPGCGTTFKIYLPRIPAAVELMPDSTSQRPPLPTRAGTVLLAEDEEAVRSLGSLALRSAGYSVVEARDGEEALELSQRHSGPMDLLLTDVVMPKMNGLDLADRLVAMRPEIKVLYMSGYTGDAVSRFESDLSSKPFLQKPFTVSVLANKVHEVLGH
jgi:two-component system, cell cycle sensor histidine kinase and response regulator CckA